MPLYETTFFRRTVDFLRRWKWFDKYIYGRSINYEDFYRNPAEALYESVYPFWVSGAEPEVLFALRAGYITHPAADYPGTPGSHRKTLSKSTVRFRGDRWTYFDLALLPPWQTKYYNAAFAFQVGAMRKRWALYPYITLVIRFTDTTYFQAGIGWGYEIHGDSAGGSFFTKFRVGHYEKEKQWNAKEIYGFYEGFS